MLASRRRERKKVQMYLICACRNSLWKGLNILRKYTKYDIDNVYSSKFHDSYNILLFKGKEKCLLSLKQKK